VAEAATKPELATPVARDGRLVVEQPPMYDILPKLMEKNLGRGVGRPTP